MITQDILDELNNEYNDAIFEFKFQNGMDGFVDIKMKPNCQNTLTRIFWILKMILETILESSLRKRTSTLDITILQAVSGPAQYKNVKLFNNNTEQLFTFVFVLDIIK